MMRRLFFIVIFLLSAFYAAAQGCAMCKASVESNARNGENVGGGLNPAILYLMAAPYLLLFFFFRKKIWAFLKEIRAMWN